MFYGKGTFKWSQQLAGGRWLRAFELSQRGWKQREVAEALGMMPGTVPPMARTVKVRTDKSNASRNQNSHKSFSSFV
jgi:hypothetical protein